MRGQVNSVLCRFVQFFKIKIYPTIATKRTKFSIPYHSEGQVIQLQKVLEFLAT